MYTTAMVILDVMSLFTRLPIDEALSVILRKLASDSTLEERTSISIENVMEMLSVCTDKILRAGERFG